MVRLFTKDQLPECVRHILQVESEYAAIDDIEIVWEAEAESLTSSQARALRVCGRRHEARVVRLSSLRQGMSDARTLRIRLMGTNGTAVAHLVGKLGLLADVHDELSRYEMHVGPRLPQGSFTPLATVVRAGAGRGGGLFYTLAEQYSESLFSLLARDETAAVAVLDRLKDIEGRWTGGVPAVEETVSEARRRLQKDDAVVLARLSDRIDVATFEARSLQVRRAVEHGDLHGENVLVDPEARAVLIDYGSVIAATASLDPVTLELSLLFHPRGAAIRGEWPAPDVVATWSDLDRYVEHCPVPAFVRACRSWAWEVGNGGREVLSNAYAYATRQFGYPDVTQDLARAVAVSAATAFQAT